MKIFCYSAQLKELQNKTLNIIFNIHFQSHVWLVWFPFQSFSSYLARALDHAQKTKGRHKKKSIFLGKSPKLWVGGGQES